MAVTDGCLPYADEQSIRTPILWGLAFGAVTVVAPLAIWWLDQAPVHALSIVLIAAVYIGFAVADGRLKVLLVEATIAAIFVILAATAVTETAWLLVIAYAGHGLKDLWQHRTHFVANTRWWPPLPGRRLVCCPRSRHRDRGRGQLSLAMRSDEVG